MTSRKYWAYLFSFLLILAFILLLLKYSRLGENIFFSKTEKVGSEKCVQCHQSVYEQWKSSSHFTEDIKDNEKPGKTAFIHLNRREEPACEDCHGAASGHILWAEKNKDKEHSPAGNGPEGFGYKIPGGNSGPGIGRAAGTVSAAGKVLPLSAINLCGRCHSGWLRIGLEIDFNRPLLSAFVPDSGFNHKDEYNSYLSSGMFAAGLSCSSCHDPHQVNGKEVRDETCLECHLAEKYHSRRHHFHDPGSKGGSCIACHMPRFDTGRNGILRSDHSFSPPPPGRSKRTGQPNACNACHSDKPVEWAVMASGTMFGEAYNDSIGPDEIFFMAAQKIPGAGTRLAEIAENDSLLPIVRAKALFYLNNYKLNPEEDPSEFLLKKPDPYIRYGAVMAQSDKEIQERYRLLYPLMFDTLEGIRFAAQRALSGMSLDQVGKVHKLDFSQAMNEYVHTLSRISDLPQTSLEIGNYHISNGNYAMADSSFRMALRIDSLYFPAYEALARLFLIQDDSRQAKEVLENALAKYPFSAPLHHYYAEFLAGQGQITEAIVEYKTACVYEPGNSAYVYDLAGALNVAGQDEMALETLRQAAQKFPYDFRIKLALAGQLISAGDLKESEALMDNIHSAMPWNKGLDVLFSSKNQ